MKSFSILLILLFSTQSFAQPEEFDIKVLPEDAQKAFEVLVNTRHYEDLRNPFVARRSSNVRSFGIVLDQGTYSAPAFREILKKGTVASKLYALSGLFYTDVETFNKEAGKLLKSEQKVRLRNGRYKYEVSVSQLIESNADNVAIIGSGESFEQYFAGSTHRSYVLDIMNGGYPAALRHFAEKQKERGIWKRSTLRWGLAASSERP